MNSKVKIKVIKKNAPKAIKEVPEIAVNEEDLQKTTNNKIVSTISTWVNEFQEEHRQNALKSIMYLDDLAQNDSAL